jgi:hypothetical protein
MGQDRTAGLQKDIRPAGQAAGPGKEEAKALVNAALRLGDLPRAREVADAARRLHSGYSMARLALRVQLLQADHEAAAATFLTLRQQEQAEFLAGIGPEEALPLTRALSAVFARTARAMLALPQGVEVLLPLLRAAAEAEPALAAAVLEGLLAAHGQGAPDALLLALAFAFSTAQPEDAFPLQLLDRLSALLRAGWPAATAASRVDALLPLLTGRAARGGLAAAVASVLADLLARGQAPDAGWGVFRPVAAAAAALAGTETTEAWLARHGAALTSPEMRVALAYPALMAGDRPAWAMPAIPLADARRWAREGSCLPLLLALDQRGTEAEPQDEPHRLPGNPAYARLRPVMMAALASAERPEKRLALLRALLGEGDAATVWAVITARPDLLETEEGALIALHSMAGERERIWMLPDLGRLLQPLRTPRTVQRACRLLIAAGEEEAASGLIAALAEREPEEAMALRLELLRTSGQLGAWSALARQQATAIRPAGAAALRREIQLWQDEERPDAAAQTVSLPEDDDSRRASVRRHLFERRFDQAAAEAGALVARTGQAADHHALVLALCQAEQFTAALGAAAVAQARFPAELRFPIKQAQIAEALLDFDRALHHWQVVASIDIRAPQALCGTARSLLALGRQDALEALLRYLPGDQVDFLWVHNLGALAAMRRGDTARAREAHEAGRRIACTFVEAVRTRARQDPAMAWWNGAWFRHRRAEHASSMIRFEEGFASRLADAARPCIVVGNSPRLMEQRVGEVIDGFGTVLRLNDFVTAGFEVYTGHRTDLWYSSGNRHARKQDLRAFDLAVIGAGPAPQLPELEPYGRMRLGLPLDAARACLLPPAYTALSEAAAYPKPTSGFRMILLAHYLCPEAVNIAGFDFFTQHKEHYFDRGTNSHKPGETHAGWFERAIVEEVLVPFGRVRTIKE